ncbi:hypothetical protein GIB67_019220 [Kingdonia uniflora]|uniref:Uncharacterized protein n=1 Tax=Kingdonia uniflora TaxID=39325 RepID=A0A7J7MZT5_9MAGN|nr:hypothetical protein GIB67_019220 [Kingdonia uniflora]
MFFGNKIVCGFDAKSSGIGSTMDKFAFVVFSEHVFGMTRLSLFTGRVSGYGKYQGRIRTHNILGATSSKLKMRGQIFCSRGELIGRRVAHEDDSWVSE